ncbi:MAG: hypothetical protein DRQ88_01980 [Epsilonproteobacteria bacterium]|nr:MAG: hypothetical protein DRQ89_00725 [Campylobacterota bacterium]RLA67632.1 MAG: hypothetical protein DRQ88_01980 [Campylobacterota bacterium]
MAELPPEIETFLNFIIEEKLFDNQAYFYNEIDNYLKKEFSSIPLEVYSIHSKEKKTSAKRKIWAHNIKFSHYNELDKIDLEVLTKDKFIFVDNLLCLLLGDFGDYVKVILIDARSFVGKEAFLKIFTRYLENSFKKVKMIEAIKEDVGLIDIDDVTGLFNSRKLRKDLDEGIKRFEATGERFSLLFIDIDHFKNVNDGHGHLIGTELLSELAKELKKILRLYDHLYRYGGDEFVILLPKADSINAEQIGSRILEVVKEKDFIPKKGDKTFKLSLSIGVASFPDHAPTADDLLAIADKMMYHAKDQGRGRVCLVDALFDKKD